MFIGDENRTSPKKCKQAPLKDSSLKIEISHLDVGGSHDDIF